ncbi:hypothetical protein F5Y16DRAFT_371002 [Xylariaceae sp. FL0255]|nr:hypothetical protein F5Y16DRAFT_371002 [Xylariaceae sp. FL0255]
MSRRVSRYEGTCNRPCCHANKRKRQSLLVPSIHTLSPHSSIILCLPILSPLSPKEKWYDSRQPLLNGSKKPSVSVFSPLIHVICFLPVFDTYMYLIGRHVMMS